MHKRLKNHGICCLHTKLSKKLLLVKTHTRLKFVKIIVVNGMFKRQMKKRSRLFLNFYILRAFWHLRILIRMEHRWQCSLLFFNWWWQRIIFTYYLEHCDLITIILGTRKLKNWHRFGKYLRCNDCYTAGLYYIIDKSLEAFSGLCSVQQYIPSKLNKYDIKISSVVNAWSFYTKEMKINAGKQPVSPFQLNNNPVNVVIRLIDLTAKRNNFSWDNQEKWMRSKERKKELHSVRAKKEQLLS